jgi:hypothetical protein
MLRRMPGRSVTAVIAATCAAALGCGDDRERGAPRPPALPEPTRLEDSGPPRTAAERRRRAALRRDQRPVVAPLAGRDAVGETEAAITLEARERRRRGELRERVRETRCDPPRRLIDGALATTCVASTASGSGVVVGVPFVALIAPTRDRVTFCKRNIGAGEGASLGGVRVALPHPCRRALYRR